MSYDYNTIDGLLVFLEGSCADRRWAEAIRALVVERDALKETIVLLQSRAESSEALNSTAVSIISQRDALKQRVAELEAQRPADRDLELRERLVESALQAAARDAHMEHQAAEMGQLAVYMVDAAIAAMRKGEA